MCKRVRMFIFFPWSALFIFWVFGICTADCKTDISPLTVIETAEYMTVNYKELSEKKNKLTTDSLLIEEETNVSDKDVNLIALVTMAEAEGECEEGKRLVIDTILNRVDSQYFPDSVFDVVYQPYQFSSMWNGRVERCEVREDICNLVREELHSRTNYETVFFTADYYGEYGVPMFKVGNHFFSSYE